jgi:capsular polysaccharide biosynthesis protein
VSISKHLLETGLAGLVVGLLVSVLILSFLTATDRSARRAEDIRRSLGLDVVATIGRFTSPTTAVRGGDA